MLIAGELNLEVPEISFSDLVTFLEETKDLHTKSPGMSREEEVYGYRNSKPYPWDRRILEVKGKPFYDYKNKSPFSSLVPIIDQLPIIPETRVILLLFQLEQPSYDFKWHFDRDSEFGFRICLGLDTTKPFLEFARMHEQYINYARDFTEKSVILEKNMIDDSKIYSIIPTKTNSVICINGHQYCHRVPVISASTRASIIVRGDLMTKEFDLRQRIDDEFHS